MTTAIEPTSAPSDPDIVQTIRDRTIDIVKLARDVFVGPYDLVLLDRSRGILGGHWKTVGDRYATESISDALFTTYILPTGWTDWGTYYFLPGLSMDDDLLATLRAMPEPDQFRALVKVKRALVDSESSQVSVLDRKFWIEMLGEPIAFKKRDMFRGDVNEGFGKVFLGERYLDRFGGNARALDQMVGPEFKLDDAIEQINQLISQLSVDLKHRHEEACGEYRATAAV